MRLILNQLRKLTQWFEAIVWLAVFAVACLIIRLRGNVGLDRCRVVLGSDPIINNKYYRDAIRQLGIEATTVVTTPYSINKRSDWDRIIEGRSFWQTARTRQYLAYLSALWRFDVYIISFRGLFLADTPIEFFQHLLYRLAHKKVLVLPYGSDGYAYRHIRSLRMLHAIQVDYPGAARMQSVVAARVEYWCKHADLIVPGIMFPDGIGRSDLLIPSTLFIDLNEWRPSLRNSYADGVNGTVVVAHSPNHRGVKGTEFLIEAVKRLKAEGLKVELILLEGVTNENVKTVLQGQADILVEKLVTFGHALSGLEGMASALPVISSPQDNELMEPYRIWSYFDECPIVGSSPNRIVDDLRQLVTNPTLREALGRAGRQYVEKYHGLESAKFFFESIFDFMYGRRQSLANLYHPLIGEYRSKEPKVIHPLVDNRFVP